MQVGKLRDRIRLLALTGERDAAGELLDTVNEVATVYADVRVVSGREMVRSGVDINQQIFTIRIRARKVFLWRPPAVNRTIKVVCREWDVKAQNLYADVSCQFDEVVA